MDELVGVYLKNAREGKKMTLDEVAKETKIQKRYLEAIESDNFDEIPGETYAKGFLRNYAGAVGISPGEIIEKYDKKMKKAETINANDEAYNRELSNEDNQKLTRNVIISFIVLFIFYILVTIAAEIYKRVNSDKKNKVKIEEASSTIPEKPAAEAIPALENVSQAVPDTTTETPIVPFDEKIEKAKIKEDKQEPVKQETKKENKTEAVQEGNVNTQDQKKVEAAESVSDAKQIKLDDVKVEKVELKTLKVIATGTSWVEIIEGNATVFKGNINQGITKTIKSKDRIFVRIGDAANVKIEFNGKDLGVLGKPKEVVRKEF